MLAEMFKILMTKYTVSFMFASDPYNTIGTGIQFNLVSKWN